MSFKIKIHGKVGCSLRDVGRQELERAIQTLDAGNLEAAAVELHTVRKRLKKLRAIALLLRPAIGTKAYRKTDRALRDVGRVLGALRDQQTISRTLRKLQVRFFEKKRPDALRLLEERIAAHAPKSAQGDSPCAGQNSPANVLRSVLAEIGDWDLKKYAWSDVRTAIRRSYQRARDGFQESSRWKERGRTHRWRKRVKELYYHVRLIRRASPDALEELAQDLGILAEFLGDEHDLVVLRDSIQRVLKKNGDGRFAETLIELIDLRRGELLDAALDLCGRIFDESPGQFIRALDEQRAEHQKRRRKEKRLVAEFTSEL
jgi:CHAD domain-containing protein